MLQVLGEAVKRRVPGLQPVHGRATRGPYFAVNCCVSTMAAAQPPPASVIHLQPRPLNLNASPAERSYLTEVAPLLSFVAEETPEEVKGGGLTI